MLSLISLYVLMISVGVLMFTSSYFAPDLQPLFFIAFWGLSIFLDICQGRGFMETNKQRFIGFYVAVSFLMYFLPPELAETQIADLVSISLDFCLVVIVVFMTSNDDDDDSGHKRRTKEKTENKNLKWVPQL